MQVNEDISFGGGGLNGALTAYAKYQGQQACAKFAITRCGTAARLVRTKHRAVPM